MDIQSDTEFAQAEADAAFAGEDDTQEFSGRCAATLSNGKRCPNAALPGSHYCGVPAHQAVASQPAGATPVEVPTVDEVEEAIEDAARIAVAEDIAAAATLEAVVEEAVATGEITPEDGALIEEAIESAAVEAVVDDIAAAAELESTIEHDEAAAAAAEGDDHAAA